MPSPIQGWASSRTPTRCTTRKRTTAGRRITPRCSTARCPVGMPRPTARRSTSSARTSTASCSRAPRRARTGSRRSATRSWSSRWRPPTSANGRRSRLPRPEPTILAMGGGGFTMEPENPALDDFVLGLAEGIAVPKICLLPTASGDGEAQIRQFHATFGARGCEPMYISLFRLGSRPVPLRETLLAQDIIYVGGGSMLGLLAVWRALGHDVILREAWESGVVLAGLSAGAMCWFEWGITKPWGYPAPSRGLGSPPGSMSVHRDGEPPRLPICRASIADGTIPPGYAADDGVALLFHGTELADVVSSRANRKAVHIAPDGDEPLKPRLLSRADRFGVPSEIAEFRAVR